MYRPIELEQRNEEEATVWNLEADLEADSSSPLASERPANLKAFKPAAEESELDKIFNR